MSKTFRLFWISFTMVSISMIVATLGQYGFVLAAVITIAFGISIAGLILGVAELKVSKRGK